MQTEVHSQTAIAPPTEVHSQPQAPVTASGSPLDNATNPNPSETPPQTGAQVGETGAVVDEVLTEQAPALPSWDEYAKRKEALLSNKSAAPAPTTTAPVAAPANPAPAPAPAAPASDEDEFHPSLPAEGGKMPKMRVRPASPVDVRALSEFNAYEKAGGTQTMVEYITERYGPKAAASATAAPDATTTSTPAPATSTAPPSAPADGLPKTPAEIDAAAADLKAQKKLALDSFDHDKVIELDGKLEALADRKLQLVEAEFRSKQETETRLAASDEESLVAVAKMFPQASKADDPLVAKAGEVLEAWEASKDPLATHPKRYLFAYTEAASQMGLAPGAPAAVQTSSPTPPVHRPPPSAIIAGGQAPSSPQAVEAPLTRENYHEQKAKFLAKRAA